VYFSLQTNHILRNNVVLSERKKKQEEEDIKKYQKKHHHPQKSISPFAYTTLQKKIVINLDSDEIEFLNNHALRDG